MTWMTSRWFGWYSTTCMVNVLRPMKLTSSSKLAPMAMEPFALLTSSTSGGHFVILLRCVVEITIDPVAGRSRLLRSLDQDRAVLLPQRLPVVSGDDGCEEY